MQPDAQMVLVVDLDDTLVRTDLLWEAVIQLVLKRPWVTLSLIPMLLVQGRAAFKKRVADLVPALDATGLPYRESILNLIREHKRVGGQVILASASPSAWVQSVANYLGLFDTVLSSDAGLNLKGAAKLQRLQAALSGQAFGYVGDSRADLPLWSAAQAGWIVNAPSALVHQAKSVCSQMHVIKEHGLGWRTLFRQLRWHQWSKNSLVVVPLLAAHRFAILDRDAEAGLRTLLAVGVFSLAASTVYIFNDLLDLPTDRLHPSKRLRPFASGDLPVSFGAALGFILLGLSLIGAIQLGIQFLALILLYWVLNIGYSIAWKRVVMLDVVILAALYTLRILAGATAADVPVSPWLLSFSTFLFFGLALMKRSIELLRIKADVKSRGYRMSDRPVVLAVGIASSLISVLILVMYFQSAQVVSLYGNPDRLWLWVPVLMVTVGRLWIQAERGVVDDDPVVYALRDRGTWLSLFALGLILLLAL